MADEPRTPKLSDQAQADREAIVVAKPVKDRVHDWQAQIGILSVLANRSGKGVERLVELSDRARVLGRAINDEQLAFAAAIELLAAGVAKSPRIGNARRDLAKAADAIRTIQAILASG
jgi:hypothetical protein